MLLSTVPLALRNSVARPPDLTRVVEVNEPAFEVEFAVAVWFWVLVSSAEMRVSTSRLFVKYDTRMLWPDPNDVEPVPAELATDTGMAILLPIVMVGAAVILYCT